MPHHERIACSACKRETCMCRTVSKGSHFPYVCEDCAKPPISVGEGRPPALTALRAHLNLDVSALVVPNERAHRQRTIALLDALEETTAVGEGREPADPPSPADEEEVPHPFNLRTHARVGEEIREGIWCKDCAYHRDHKIHSEGREPADVEKEFSAGQENQRAFIERAWRDGVQEAEYEQRDGQLRGESQHPDPHSLSGLWWKRGYDFTHATNRSEGREGPPPAAEKSQK